MNNFNEMESLCAMTFSQAGPIHHLWTPEDHEIIFTRDAEFKIAMNIMGIGARIFPDVRILTFEWMSNHLHLMAASDPTRLQALFDLIKTLTIRQLKVWGRPNALSRFECKHREINSLDDARNVLVYDNRNGFLVNPATSPFTYPWGANRYYFNTDAQLRFVQSSRKMTVREIRETVQGRFADKIDTLLTLDGYACPMDYCDIKGGEGLFRDARHYFFSVSRNIESQKQIAAELGERIYYTDDELFAAIVAHCKSHYQLSSPTSLPAQAKIDVARLMHYEYNAGNKQIQRMLRLDAGTVGTMFPQRSPKY